MLQGYAQSGIGFLTFNHRGHDCVAEGYRDGRLEYVGGSVEMFEDCALDIAAAASYVRQYVDKVIVQGHSNGAEKVLFFAQECPDIPSGIVLISPSDSHEMQRRYRRGEDPEAQARRLASFPNRRSGIDLLPLDEYGIRTGDKSYPIPVTRESLLDLLSGPAFRVLKLGETSEGEQDVGVPTLVCLGEEDPYLTIAPLAMAEEVGRRIGTSVALHFVPKADHHFHGHEHQLVSGIVRWCDELALGLEAMTND